MKTHLVIDRDKSRDTGMAITLLLLLLEVWLGGRAFLFASAAVLFLAMTIPLIFKPLGYLWFGLAYALGLITSRAMLTVVFIVFVLPVGLARRILGKDPLLLSRWKKGTGSVLVTRDHDFNANDIAKPY